MSSDGAKEKIFFPTGVSRD